jgi:hypothetical protein
MTEDDDAGADAPLMTRDEFRARILAMGIRIAGFARATMVSRNNVQLWGKTRDFPGWVHSWLILAEQSPELVRMLASRYPPGEEPPPRVPPPRRQKKGDIPVRPEIRTERRG